LDHWNNVKSDFKEGRWGYAFKNGKLYSFEPRHVLVMTPWPDPRAWYKRRSHGWRPNRKLADELFSKNLFSAEDIDLLPDVPDVDPSGQRLMTAILKEAENWSLKVQRRNTQVMGSYFDAIPGDVRSELLKYSERKWHLLNMFARCPGAMDLSHSNPALLYALASNWIFHKPAVQRPIRAARSLMNKKQKHILSWIGFPGTETARRIMAKVVPRSLSINALLYLRDGLIDPQIVKTLFHLERINAGALRLVTDARFRPHVTPQLLSQICRDQAQDVLYPPITSILADALQREALGPGRNPHRRFASV